VSQVSQVSHAVGRWIRASVHDRRNAVATLVVGFLLVVAAQRGAGMATPPLYDGVVIEEPYRYLSPGPGQMNNPPSYAADVTVNGTTSPPIAGATSEVPPQAQLIVPQAALVVAQGTTKLHVTIQPVAPPAATATNIVGNVYQFAVADDHGNAVAPASDADASIVLRAPAGAGDVSIAVYGAAGWLVLPTESTGQPDTWTASTPAFGDFALIGSTATTILGVSPLVAGGVGLLLLVAIGVSVFLWRDNTRKERLAAAETARKGRPVPRNRRNRRR
jgi:hypothetical protein